MRLWYPFVALTLLCSSIAPALAAGDTSRFELSGFGTLGYVHNDQSGSGFTRDLSQPQRGGLGAHLLPDSRLGAQLNYRSGPRLEFVAQLVARDQARLTAAHAVEWAFVALRPLPEADLRLGRIGLDVFMLSDYRNVGYAYPWVRPVMEFYSWVPVYSFDGADLSYAFDAGPGRWRMKLLGGRSRPNSPSKVNSRDYKLDIDPLWGASLAFERDAWRAKLSYVEVRFASQPPTAELTDPLERIAVAGLPGISAEAAALRRELAIEGARTRYAALGASYDDNRWQAQAEYSVLSGGPASVPQGWRGYVSAGRRFGDVMPFAVLAWARPDAARARAGADWSALPAGAALQAAALQAIDIGRIDQHTTSLGLRWEFSHTAALKLQWDRIRVAPQGWGLWPMAEDTGAGVVNLLTSTVDWVF